MPLPSWLYGGPIQEDKSQVKTAPGGSAPFFGVPATKAAPSESSALWDSVLRSSGEAAKPVDNPPSAGNLMSALFRPPES